MARRLSLGSSFLWIAADWRCRAVTAVALLATAIFVQVQSARATGEALQYTVYMGLNVSSVHQYGAHFDEGSNGYMGRDFNAPSEGTAWAQLRIYVSTYQPSGLAFKFTHLSSSCGVNAQAGYINGSGSPGPPKSHNENYSNA